MARKIVKNKDGSISTERTATVTHPKLNQGLPTNIPTMFKGRQHSEVSATQKIIRNKGVDPETGRRLPAFLSIAEAVSEAQQRSQSLGRKLKGQ